MNSTNFTKENIKSDCSFGSIAPYFGYIILGFVAFIGNMLMSGIIMKDKQLRRKELLVFWGLSFSDMFYGLGNLITGCRRMQLSCTGNALELVNTRFCQAEIHPILLLGAGQHSALMMVLLSIDRFMAIIAFDVYIGFTKMYSMVVLTSAYLFSVGSMAYGIFDGYLNSPLEPSFNALCNAARSTSAQYSRFSFLFTVGCSTTSCVIYVAVIIANFMSVKKMAPNGTQMSSLYKAHMNTQRRLTVTLGVSSLFTFFFHAIPFSILALGTYFQSVLAVLGPYMGIFFCTNASVNVFIFMWRHKRFRKAMTCQNSLNAVSAMYNTNTHHQPYHVANAPQEQGI